MPPSSSIPVSDAKVNQETGLPTAPPPPYTDAPSSTSTSPPPSDTKNPSGPLTSPSTTTLSAPPPYTASPSPSTSTSTTGPVPSPPARPSSSHTYPRGSTIPASLIGLPASQPSSLEVTNPESTDAEAEKKETQHGKEKTKKEGANEFMAGVGKFLIVAVSVLGGGG